MSGLAFSLQRLSLSPSLGSHSHFLFLPSSLSSLFLRTQGCCSFTPKSACQRVFSPTLFLPTKELSFQLPPSRGFQHMILSTHFPATMCQTFFWAQMRKFEKYKFQYSTVAYILITDQGRFDYRPREAHEPMCPRGSVSKHVTECE